MCGRSQLEPMTSSVCGLAEAHDPLTSGEGCNTREREVMRSTQANPQNGTVGKLVSHRELPSVALVTT